jgi:Tol biopolymer transport system component
LFQRLPPIFSAYKFTPLAPGGIDERDSVWSPDGKSIAYTARVHGTRQVFARSIGSPDDAQLTTAGDCWHLFWSPDGQLIYYSSGGNLWSVPAAAGTARPVLEKADAASIHPDGKTLAFVRDGKVWISSLNGGQLKEFWPGPIDRPWDITLSRFSPDGSALALSANGVLWVLPYPSGRPRRFEATAKSAYGVAWFPDSRSLLTAEPGPADTGALVRITIADGNRQTIYTSTSSLFQPSVSPDGQRIAFSSGASEWDVVEVAFSGGNVHTLVGGGVGINWFPDWAPSGKHFLYMAGGAAIDREASDGGFSRRLAETNSPGARWSPDGAHFAYMDDDHRLILASASGGRAVLLDQGSSLFLGLAWSPDGQWICYLYGERGAFHLAKIQATPGATPVTRAGLSGA